MNQIKSTLQNSIKKLSGPISPQEALEVSKTIEQYHPVATLKVNAEFNPSDIEKTKEKAESVIETIENMSGTGQNKDEIAKDPKKAVEAISNKVKEKVQQAAAGGA